MKAVDIPIGQKFSFLTVLGEGAPDKFGHRTTLCLCDCGKTVSVITTKLRTGVATSCTCMRAELIRRSKMRHGHSSKKYGMTPTYTSWYAMKRRCLVRKEYTSRNITVCSRWQSSFDNFLFDMGVRPKGKTLDRINNDGNYEPSNCRWATASEQARNTRRSRRPA